MLKFLSRNIFRIYYNFIPSSRLIGSKRGRQINKKQAFRKILSQNGDLKDFSHVFPSSKLSSSSIIRQHIINIYSDLYKKNPSRKVNRLSFKEPNIQYNSDLNLKRMVLEFSETISDKSHLLSLNAVKKCLIMMKKANELGGIDNELNEALSQLESRFYFLHDNYFLFEKKFKESIIILRSFTALNYKLNNKKYLDQWYKHALNNLKFFNTSDICDILYISVFQVPGNKEIYDTVKLQLFRPTPLYYQEVLKAKLAVNPKEFNKVVDFIKTTISKLVLSSYQRKGLYWEKDFVFRLNDTVKLLQSYIQKGENNGAYLSLIVNILQQNLQESLKETTDVFRHQKALLKILPIFIHLSEKEKQYLGEKYYQIIDVLVTLLINVIPAADMKRVLMISESFESLCKDAQCHLSIEVCKFQLIELIGKNVELIEGKEVVLGLSEAFLKIFVNLRPIYLQKANENQEQSNASILEEKFRNILNIYFEKISVDIEEILLKHKANLALLNKIFKEVEIGTETTFENLRRKIVDIDFSKTKNTSSFAFDYLLCFSIINTNQTNLPQTAYNNLAFLVDYLYNNLEIKSLTSEVCELFFEIFNNFRKQNHFEVLQDSVKEKIEKVQKSFLRFIADHYQEFSIPSLERILNYCMEGEFLEIDFDDGSGLYTQNIIQELYGYVTEHYKEFSNEFQNKVKPFLDKYAEATMMENLAENIKNLSL